MRPGNGVWDEAAKEGNLDKEALWELREGHDSEKAGKPLGSNKSQQQFKSTRFMALKRKAFEKF